MSMLQNEHRVKEHVAMSAVLPAFKHTEDLLGNVKRLAMTIRHRLMRRSVLFLVRVVIRFASSSNWS